MHLHGNEFHVHVGGAAIACVRAPHRRLRVRRRVRRRGGRAGRG
jgi:hypothetical protein